MSETIVERSRTEHVLIRDRPVSIVAPAQQGPQGPAGGATTTVINTTTPSLTWTLVHNLGRFPAVTIIDEANDVIDTDYSYVDANVVVVSFSVPTSGKAYLN